MTAFEERERAEENRFAHEREIDFKIHARRNRLFGEWLAGRIGLTEAERKLYAASFITIDFEHVDDALLLDKAKTDLEAARQQASDQDLRAALHQASVQARGQITGQNVA
jgi:hypothetical protein